MRAKLSIFAATLAGLVLPDAFASTVYTFTILTPGGVVNQFNGGGINNNGVVAEIVSNHLFTYNINTNTYTNYNSIFPIQMGGIDDSGKIVYTSVVGGNVEGTIFDPSTNSPANFVDPVAQSTFANGVSSNGNIIAGYYVDSSSNQPGFLRNSASFSNVSYPGPHGQIYLWDANNNGDAIGLSSCCRAGVNFLLKNGVYTTILDPLGHSSNGVEYGLNNLDQVVGWYDDGLGGPLHGLLWQGGVSTTLDLPGATSTILHDINDNGAILGAAMVGGNAVLFVATPVPANTPEPGTCGLICSALLGIGIRFAVKGRFSE